MDSFENQEYDSEEDEDYVLPKNAPAEDENEAYRIKKDDQTTDETTVENVDELWAEFLKSAGETPDEKTTSGDQPTTSAGDRPTVANGDQKKTEVITTTLEQKAEIREEIDGSSIVASATQESSTTIEQEEVNPEEKTDVPSTSTREPNGAEKPVAAKRPWTGAPKKRTSALDSAMSAIKRSKKMSVLDRSKKDWEKFVVSTDIKEELENHSRSRDSYLDNQEFLAASDYRKFQKEKEVRDVARKTR